MACFVLVHGAWGGAWIWRRVLGPLRAAGHEVHAVTLTGDGERAHLRRADIGLSDHVDDVVALVRAEELQDVLLVGHSYGGMVITGAADRLLSEDEATVYRSLRALVYVDAVVPMPGECWSSLHDPATVAARTAAADANDQALPPPDPSAFGLEGQDREWLLRRRVPHPFGPYRERLDFDEKRLAGLPRTFIDCHAPAFPTIAPYRARVRQQPGWTWREIPTGHCPMVSAPSELSRMLLEAAA
jgi:pimeloyl-ACP methyl ester carboxylesterase